MQLGSIPYSNPGLVSIGNTVVVTQAVELVTVPAVGTYRPRQVFKLTFEGMKYKLCCRENWCQAMVAAASQYAVASSREVKLA